MGKIILHFYYPGPFSIVTVKATCPRRLLPQSHLVMPVLYVQFFLSQPIPTERIIPLKQNIKSRVTFSIHNYSWEFTSWHCSILISKRNPELHHNETDIHVNSQSKKTCQDDMSILHGNVYQIHVTGLNQRISLWNSYCKFYFRFLWHCYWSIVFSCGFLRSQNMLEHWIGLK